MSADTSTKTETPPKFPDTPEANNSKELPGAFSLLSAAMQVVKNNLVAFLVLIGVPSLIILIGQGPSLFNPMANATANDYPLTFLVVLGTLLSVIVTAAVIHLQLRGTENEKDVSFQEAFNQSSNFIMPIIGLMILMMLMLTAAFILFIIPFFILLPRIIMAPYFLVDQKLGVVAALKASNEAYKKYKGIWGVIGVFVLIGLSSLIPYIGWAISIILSFIYAPLAAIRYKQIQQLAHNKEPKTPVERALV